GERQLIADLLHSSPCLAVAGFRGSQQLLGLMAQLVEVRVTRKCTHFVSLSACSPRARLKEIAMTSPIS
ncbi:MAG TPA: hypothetical protein VHQ03_09045, partial [Candidatus Dormibacteraeota bacterium]|nr:hypothetical protein [Candidatus Dormibacteraeota bacterium]